MLTDFLRSTFPTDFYKWPDYYGWDGILRTTGKTPGSTECVTAVAVGTTPGTTAHIMFNHQPTTMDAPMASRTASDPRGLGYRLKMDIFNGQGYFWIFKSLFPDHEAIQSCGGHEAQPAINAPWTSWMVATSTLFGTSVEPAQPTPLAPGTAAAKDRQSGIASLDQLTILDQSQPTILVQAGTAVLGGQTERTVGISELPPPTTSVIDNILGTQAASTYSERVLPTTSRAKYTPQTSGCGTEKDFVPSFVATVICFGTLLVVFAQPDNIRFSAHS